MAAPAHTFVMAPSVTVPQMLSALDFPNCLPHHRLLIPHSLPNLQGDAAIRLDNILCACRLADTEHLIEVPTVENGDE